MSNKQKQGEYMNNNINLNTLPFDLLQRIVEEFDDYKKILSQLPPVCKALQDIALPIFNSNNIWRNRLFISRINSSFTAEEKINRVAILIQKGLKTTEKFIEQCDDMYGLSPELKEVLKGEPKGLKREV
jgi:hypothetical protein